MLQQISQGKNIQWIIQNSKVQSVNSQMFIYSDHGKQEKGEGQENETELIEHNMNSLVELPCI